MSCHRVVGRLLLASLLSGAKAAWAAIPVALPAGESSSAWREPLAMAGLEAGNPGSAAGAWVAGGAIWRVEVHDASGHVHRVEVAPPRNASEREDFAWLLASLLQPVGSETSWVPSAPAVTESAPPLVALVSPAIKAETEKIASPGTPGRPGERPRPVASPVASTTETVRPPTSLTTSSVTTTLPRAAPATASPATASPATASPATASPASPPTKVAAVPETGPSTPEIPTLPPLVPASSEALAPAEPASPFDPASAGTAARSEPIPPVVSPVVATVAALLPIEAPDWGPLPPAANAVPSAVADSATSGTTPTDTRPIESPIIGVPVEGSGNLVERPNVPTPGVWVRGGGGVDLRTDTTAQGVMTASGGVSSGFGRVGVVVAVTTSGDLETLSGDRTLRRAEGGVGAWITGGKEPWRVLAAGLVFSASSHHYAQEGEEVGAVVVPVLTADLQYDVPLGRFLLCPNAALSRDLRETELQVGTESSIPLSPWSARFGLSIAPRSR